MKRSRSIATAALLIACIIALTGCFSSLSPGETTNKADTTTEKTTEKETTTKETTVEVTTEETTAQGTAEIGKPIIIGDYEVTIQKVVLAKDYDGKDAITIIYDWTNNSSKTVSPIFAVSFTVFQDGKELKMAILMDDETADSTAEVRPKISVEGLGSHFNTTSKSELEIEIGELISFDDPILLKVPYPQE